MFRSSRVTPWTDNQRRMSLHCTADDCRNRAKQRRVHPSTLFQIQNIVTCLLNCFKPFVPFRAKFDNFIAQFRLYQRINITAFEYRSKIRKFYRQQSIVISSLRRQLKRANIFSVTSTKHQRTLGYRFGQQPLHRGRIRLMRNMTQQISNVISLTRKRANLAMH